MRTTIILPDDLYDRVRKAAAEDRRTVTSLVEEALRAALRERSREPVEESYVVRPLSGRGLQPGVALDDNAALADLLDLE